MAYTEILSNRAGLRDQLYTKDNLALQQQNEIDAAGSFGRGWKSSGLSEEAGYLLDQANNAYRAGDNSLGQALEMQGRDKMARAQQWAPTVQNFTDVNSVGSAVDWATGSLGQGLRSTLPSIAGGLVGAGVGAVAAPFTFGMINPMTGARIGSALGAAIPGYNMEANETIASSMVDPYIRANKSMQEIKDTGRVKGVAAGALEAVMPAMMVGKAAGLAGRVAKGDRLAAIGKSAGQGALTEFATEGAQDITGQVAENSLKDQALSNIDYKQAFNAGMAGAVAGGGMGAMGGAAQVATSQLGAGVDKVNEVRKDPIGAVADGIADLGGKLGTAAAKAQAAISSKFENSFNEEAAARSRLLSEHGTEADARAHAERIVLRQDASESSREDAAKLIAGQMSWETYRDKRFIKHEEGRRSSLDEDISNEIAQRTGESKQSRMSPVLVDDFGEQEGRDTSEDSVIDDFGDKKMGGADHLDHPPVSVNVSEPNTKLSRKTRAEHVRSAKLAVSADNAVNKARAAEIGQPVQPKQGGVKAQRQEEIIGLADIWRKQGVDSKLIESSEKLNTTDRASAIATMGWVARGFTDTDGELFVPESFTKKYKDKSVARIAEATKLAVAQGLLDADTAKGLIVKVGTMAKKQWADQTNVLDTVFSAVQNKPLGRQWSKDDVEGFIPELRRMAEHGTTKREEDFLVQLFGSKEGIAKAMSAFKEPKKAANLLDDKQKTVKESDELGDTESDARYDSILTIDEPKTRAKFQGRKQRGEMFNTKYANQKTELEQTVNALNDGGGVHARAIGVLDAMKEEFGANHPNMRAAENEALWAAVKRNGSTDAQKNEYLAQINALPAEQREQQLRELNKTHKKIRVEHMDTGHVADTIRPDQIASFKENDDPVIVGDVRENKKAPNPFVKPSDGMIYLERKVASSKGAVDPETGEITAGTEAFKTSTFKLLKHIWAAEEREKDGRTNGAAGKGVKGEYEAVLRGLSALLSADDSFTGRIGFKKNARSEVTWLDTSEEAFKLRSTKMGHRVGPELPLDLKLKSGTVSDAWKRIRSERQSGQPMNFKMAEVKTVPLMRRELTRLAAHNETSYPLKLEIESVLKAHAENPRNRRDALIELYERLYQQWNKADPEIGFVGEGLTDAQSHSIKDNDLGGKEVHRNEDGSLKTAAGMASVEGNARGGDRVATVNKNADRVIAESLVDNYGNELHTELRGRRKKEVVSEPKLRDAGGQPLIPRSAERMKELLTHYPEGTLRIIRTSEVDKLIGALSTLSGVVEKMHNVVHIAVAREGSLGRDGLHSVEAVLLGDGKSAIVLDERLFGKRLLSLSRTFAHEVAHTFEEHHKLADFLPSGDIAELARAIPKDTTVGNILQYPLDTEKHAKVSYPAELHAQLFAIMAHSDRRGELKELSPKLFKIMEKMYGNERTSRQDKREREGFDRVKDFAARQGHPVGSSGQRWVAGVGQAGRGETNSRAGEAPDRARLEALKAYLEKAKAANHNGLITALSDAIRRVEAGKEGVTIAGALKVAEKTFGSLGVKQVKQNAMSTRIHDELGKKGFGATHDSPIRHEGVFNWRKHKGNGEGSASFGAGTYLSTADDSRIETNYVSFNSQTPNTTQATKEEVAAAREEITRTLGDSVKLAFKKNLGGISGDWREGDTVNAIRIALNSDVLGTAYHESMHEFFNMLSKRGATATQELLKRVATNGLVMKQLEHLLYKHPEALKQVQSDPEEALAFMYQFWRAGALKLGPQADTLFGKIARFFKNVYAALTKQVRDEQHAEMIMRAFASGAAADVATRDAVIKALNEKTELHNKALENVKTLSKRFSENALGKLTMTANGIMQATGVESIVKISKMFHQGAGESMVTGEGWRGAFFDAVHEVNNRYQNKLSNILGDMDAKDVDIVREVLSGATPLPPIKRIEDAVKAMRALNEEMMDYIDKRNISRLEPDATGRQVWKKMERRKDFGMPQVWDVEALQKDSEAFKKDLLERHAKELAAIAKEANAEIAHYKKSANEKALGPAAKDAVDKAYEEFKASGKIMAPLNIAEVTPEMVADAILQRVVMSNGKVDIEESSSELGITPLAASVNRRSLSWIDPTVFDKYKQKDLYNIYSTYIANMTKRGEYTVRFGHGGEVIRDLYDAGFLEVAGGKELVKVAKVQLPVEQKRWSKAREAALEAGEEFTEPYPTLRSVGSELHKTRVGEEQWVADLKKSAKALEPSGKAIQAMEGTLGMDVTQGIRNLNSWVMTYQNLRLLVPSLFTSISDVVGLTLNGGTLNDAWNAFVRGMKEVKTGVLNDKKVDDAAARRAELWGTVDAMSLNDTIGQGYGSMYMTGKAKAISDKFFRKIGMESWNRSMRISATLVAENMLDGWASGKLDVKNASEKAKFERLYGEGASVGDIALDADGHLDVTDPKNQAAMMRFVNDAVLRPNAAIRTVWSSDPHYAMFFHLKSFTYAMHKTWLEAALKEASMGNYRPAMILLSVYLPVGIAAGAAKEMLVPGEEPPWMQGGLDGYLEYGISKAGLGGLPQYGLGAYDSGFLDLLGPTVSQAKNAVKNYDNPLKTVAGALPGGGILQRYAGE